MRSARTAWEHRRVRGLCGSAHDVLEHAPARASNERCHCDRPQTLNGAVEEDEEEQDSTARKSPASVTPKFGTESCSTRRSIEKENVSVPTRTESTALSTPSR